MMAPLKADGFARFIPCVDWNQLDADRGTHGSGPSQRGGRIRYFPPSPPSGPDAPMSVGHPAGPMVVDGSQQPHSRKGMNLEVH
jgi:hypothetical protein